MIAASVHGWVERQADQRPDATALVAGPIRLSYADLDARADRLARRLTDAGAGRGTLVGVHLPRCVDTVVAALAVLKTGAAYLMLDPAFPARRLGQMAADAGIGMAVAASATPRWLGAAVPAVTADAAGPRLPRGAGGAGPDDLACVMFTSGSTGVAKGVAAPHRAVVDTLVGQDYLPFDAGSTWLQCAPLSWDAFALEVWGALLSGGTCVLYPGDLPDPARIADLIGRHRVDTMYLSASLFNVVVDEHPDALAGLRHLAVGGEVMSPAHAARILDRLPDLRLSNGYGPVECMVFVTSHRVGAGDVAAATVPIGRPVRGKVVRVLDHRLRPAAEGAIGEVYAAGAGLAHGYLRRPALTAERFVADPFGPPGTRMYRTGDLGRWRADGTLEFVGRADDQVKVRGFRVEPAEVAAVLARHPAVDRAAVVAEPAGPDGARLVAHLVPRHVAAPPTDSDLRAHLAAALPEFMVPAAFLIRDALPLTASGKLDRAALLARGTSTAGADPPHWPEPPATPPAPPRNAVERQLCGIVDAVLGRPGCGADSDFFALGGDSLQVIRLIARIRSAFGVNVDVPAVFAAPTPAALARHVTAAQQAATTVGHAIADRQVAATPSAPLIPADADPPPEAATGPVPLAPAQARLWFLDQVDAGVSYTVPVLVRFAGELDVDALRGALHDVVRWHEALRTLIVAVDGVPAARVVPPEKAAVNCVVVEAPEAGWDGPIVGAARHRFRLDTELPLRAMLFTDGTDRSALLLVLHHVAVDGWSLAPLARDLSRAYAARRGGGPPALGPAFGGYHAAVAAAQARLGDRSDPTSLAAAQAGYWRSTLRGLRGGLALPRLPGRAAVPGARAETVVRHVGPAVHAHVIETARRHGATAFMVAHTALTAALRRLGASSDIAIGTPVAARTGPAAEDLVGFFVNLLVLRTDVDGDPTLADLLARVREADVAALAHQELPFDQVIEVINPVRRPGRHPLVDVVLAWQNNAAPEVSFPGVEARVELPRTGAAMFELLVDVTERWGPGRTPGGLVVTVEYQADVFAPPVPRWLADALVATVTALVRTPGTRLRALGLPPPPPGSGDGDTAVDSGPGSGDGDTAVDSGPVRHMPPRTDVERRVARVIAEVLGVPVVGVHDNFFALGGNSLRAVRVAARLTAADLPVTANQLFAAPTVAELARVAGTAGVPAAPPIPRLARVPRDRPRQE